MYICAETPNLKMQPSNFVLEIARVLQPLKEETDFNDDPINSELGWAYDLLMFNILKIEAFSIMPLKGFRNRIKTCSLPFIDLPSSKIDGISCLYVN